MALGTFAAAGIADSDPMKTGFIGMRLASSLYIVPFMFAYSPELILIGRAQDIIFSIITAIIGVYCLSIAAEGYLFDRISVPVRITLFIAALILIYPSIITSSIGFCIFAIFYVSSWLTKKQKGKMAAAK